MAQEGAVQRRETCPGLSVDPASHGGKTTTHGSVRQQPVWAQSDTTSLDKPGAATLTPTDLRGGTGSQACTKSTLVLTLNQCTAVYKHSDTKLKDTHAQLVNLHRNNDQTVAATEASERQNSMYDLRSTALPLCAHFEEQHAERRWDERRRKLIIASQQDGQKQTWLSSSSRRHKGNLLPPSFQHNPIERLLAFVMIYKVTSQTDLLWQAERDQDQHYYSSRDQTSSPLPLFLCPPPVCSLGQRRMRLAQKRQATSLFSSPLAKHKPPSNRRESSALWKLLT